SNEVRSHFAYRLETVNLLAHTVTRTRKRDIKEWRVVREPVPEPVSMTPPERDFYNLVTDIVTSYCMKRDVNERFLLSTPQRQMSSCMPAALRLWQSHQVEVDASETEEGRD